MHLCVNSIEMAMTGAPVVGRDFLWEVYLRAGFCGSGMQECEIKIKDARRGRCSRLILNDIIVDARPKAYVTTYSTH